jgi:acetyl-CoA acetyltransferase
MEFAYICDAQRTPFGRYGGSLAEVRPDDLAAVALRALLARNPSLDSAAIDDVLLGCVNQAGEDNRNVARMALLLAGLPQEVPGTTVNRLCGSSMDAVAMAARAIRSGEASLAIAGGVESMSRSPLVLSKPDVPWARSQKLEDTTLGWRFVNPLMRERYGVDAMAETAENIARECGVSRSDQDAFALRSQQRCAAAISSASFAEEITPVPIPRKGAAEKDEHPRAVALLLASESAAARHGLTPRARIVGSAVAGVAPRVMGLGPVPAVRKLLERTGLKLAQMDVIELNEAFAAQALAVLRALGLPDDAAHVNPNGGAIAIGHPLGASGGRLLATAVYQLQRTDGRYALCTMCIGVGQGIATIVERV